MQANNKLAQIMGHGIYARPTKKGLHTFQLSEIFMGETARELTFLTHFLTTKRAGKISWDFNVEDIFLTYKQA